MYNLQTKRQSNPASCSVLFKQYDLLKVLKNDLKNILSILYGHLIVKDLRMFYQVHKTLGPTLVPHSPTHLTFHQNNKSGLSHSALPISYCYFPYFLMSHNFNKRPNLFLLLGHASELAIGCTNLVQKKRDSSIIFIS